MKKIILMCFFGLMFSQAKLETRVYDLEVSQGEIIDFFQVTGFDLDYFMLEILNGIPINSSPSSSVTLVIENSSFTHYGVVKGEYYPWNLDTFTWDTGAGPKRGLFLENGEDIIFNTLNGGGSWNIKLAVTAEFPIEDTGYIEEGFDFCLVPGNNLVAFPCDNPVSVETALPELAQAEIQQIIGSGVASTNVNGQFLGSLQNFTPGAGYWFKSSSSMCFNYTCTE